MKTDTVNAVSLTNRRRLDAGYFLSAGMRAAERVESAKAKGVPFVSIGGEGGIDQIVQFQGGGIRNHRLYILGLDPRLVVRKQSKLAQLMARGEAISPEQRNEDFARFGGNGEPVLSHLRVDQTQERALRVRIAGQGDRSRGALAHGAQRSVAFELAGLDDNAGVRRG